MNLLSVYWVMLVDQKRAAERLCQALLLYEVKKHHLQKVSIIVSSIVLGSFLWFMVIVIVCGQIHI